MLDKQQLYKFLVEAKKATYAAGKNAKKIIEDDNSTTLIYENGDFKYHDNYFGGEPYGGREVVFYKDTPVYIMAYYGNIIPTVLDFSPVYNILQKALSSIPKDTPFRGPKEFKTDEYTYKNQFTGEINNFSGIETIEDNEGNEIYKAQYMGGYVDQRK